MRNKSFRIHLCFFPSIFVTIRFLSPTNRQNNKYNPLLHLHTPHNFDPNTEKSGFQEVLNPWKRREKKKTRRISMDCNDDDRNFSHTG